ncbi:MAG TPA: hypothetical protein DCX77_00955 [Acidimicrobiaceae bacterium]|mgnify:FL=1|nr:hypothetical protein [Acidimicrobiaceae bacterium]|tara:strand:+ start:419 stop:655 length:237 start_codon:yes stop_codon:yes gene_type:complete
MPNENPSAQEWLTGLAAEMGLPSPSAEEIENLLNLAGVAAHSSERIAAPIACWMVGVAKIDPEEALAMVQKYENGRVS